MKVFDAKKRFFKGNLHLHTTQSDGKITPEEAIALYRAQGYDFLAITDHWKSMPTRMDGGMLVLAGMELDAMLPNQAIHIVGVGMDVARMPPIARGLDMQEGIDVLRAAGGRAILAHPAWSLNTLDVMAALRNLTAVEIYNTVSGTPWNAARADASTYVDMAAANGVLMNVIASDDAHFYDGDACQSFIQLQAEELTCEGILAGLDAGAFYASRGPAFEQIELTETELIIQCSPVAQAVFYSNLPWVGKRCVRGEGMTEIIYPLNRARKETYVRCELTDQAGRSAWCSPMSLI